MNQAVLSCKITMTPIIVEPFSGCLKIVKTNTIFTKTVYFLRQGGIKMLKQRILTVMWLLPLMLGMLCFAGNMLWGLFCGVMTLLALWEYGRMMESIRPHLTAYVSGTAIFLILALLGEWQLPKLVWYLVFIFWLIMAPMWLRKKWSPKGVWAMATGWWLMLPFWFAMMLLRPEDESVMPLLSILLLVWLADSGAYFIGKKWGKRSLCPTISPKKSWEGAIGGWVVVLIYTHLAREWGWLGIEMSWFGTMVLASVLTIVSIVGDLLESLFKRNAGVKDSSQLLMGHGGVFDRIDSLLAVCALWAAFRVLMG